MKKREGEKEINARSGHLFVRCSVLSRSFSSTRSFLVFSSFIRKNYDYFRCRPRQKTQPSGGHLHFVNLTRSMNKKEKFSPTSKKGTPICKAFFSVVLAGLGYNTRDQVHLAPMPSVTRRRAWKLAHLGNWSSLVAGVTSAPTTLTERFGTSARGISVPSNWKGTC